MYIRTPSDSGVLIASNINTIFNILGYYWLPWQPGQVLPARAVEGGVDSDGSTIYVGRAYHQGDLIPAKVIPDRNQCYLPYGGQEVCLDSCEVKHVEFNG